MRKTETSPGTASGLHITMILLGIAMTPVLLSSSSLGNQLLEGQLISVVALGGSYPGHPLCHHHQRGRKGPTTNLWHSQILFWQ